jgi:arylsulfatase
MGGAHGGLKGKGPFTYEENLHVPLIIAHPAAKAGTTCSALTSHIDLVPTFVGLTGLPESRRPAAAKALPGHDFSALLRDPVSALPHAVRPGVLFDYVGVSTVDGDYLRNVMISLFMRKPGPQILKAKLDNRGLLYVAFDGRYKIGRFYAPTAINTPNTLDELLRNNDVQVFDLQSDPGETHNLALEPEKNRETILRMNALMNTLIAKEIGANDGRYLTETIGLK